jgi:hypothetical protein
MRFKIALTSSDIDYLKPVFPSESIGNLWKVYFNLENQMYKKW